MSTVGPALQREAFAEELGGGVPFLGRLFEIDLHRPDRPRGLDRRLHGDVRVQRHLDAGSLGQLGLDLRRKEVIDQAAGLGGVRRPLTTASVLGM